ncbi:hypothetical protein TIFTF001_019186 [Ficus carica]|uniref:Uncharacterized protein n=1 Tax=Ficus carica TaxID=3494 RepID=A0AA88AWH6_FICCA|nr:hypothetical protein TIFTF001_019186 [Ficus carica]
MEGLGLISTRLLAMAMMLFVFLAIPTSLASPSPSPTPTPATPPKNSKVYHCGEGCARKCNGTRRKIRQRVHRLHYWVHGPLCMNELQKHMSKCYNGCNKDFQLSKSDEEVLQMYWKLLENVRP